MKNKLIIIICSICVLLVGIFITLFFIIRGNKYPSSYMLDNDNYFEYQEGKIECSGYASAYALRCYNIDVKGIDVYNEIPNKQSNGTVDPRDLSSYLTDVGYENKLAYNSSIAGLKKMVSNDNPIITFVKAEPLSRYYHYLVVVGYDKEFIYTADSLLDYNNSSNKHFNRRIPIDSFKEMWDTDTEIDNIYLKLLIE